MKEAAKRKDNSLQNTGVEVLANYGAARIEFPESPKERTKLIEGIEQISPNQVPLVPEQIEMTIEQSRLQLDSQRRESTMNRPIAGMRYL